MAVPAAGAAAAREEHPHAGGGEVGYHVSVVVEDLRADRNAKLDVVAVRAVLLPAAAGTAAAGGEPLLAREARQVAPARIGHGDDVAPAAAVAAVRPALRDMLLTAEAEPAVAAAARLDADLGSVVEHRLRA